MRFIKIFLIIISIFIILSIWVNFQYRIKYFFGNPPKEQILYLQKKAEENNLTALLKLKIFYAKQHDNDMFKKYHYQFIEYCKEHQNECKK